MTERSQNVPKIAEGRFVAEWAEDKETVSVFRALCNACGWETGHQDARVIHEAASGHAKNWGHRTVVQTIKTNGDYVRRTRQ